MLSELAPQATQAGSTGMNLDLKRSLIAKAHDNAFQRKCFNFAGHLVFQIALTAVSLWVEWLQLGVMIVL